MGNGAERSVTERPRLRAGVVGVGSHCRRNILPALRLVPIDPVAFCDPRADEVSPLAADYGVRQVYPDLTEMLAAEKLDAVILVVGPRQHPNLAVQALEAGIHVWMEKPPGASVADVERMQAAQAQGRCRVVVGFKKAFMPAIDKVAELFDLPSVGPLRSLVGVYPITVPVDGRRLIDGRLMNPWLANCCHPLAAMTTVAGEVAAVTVHRARLGGGVCVLEFVSGAVGTLHLADGAASSQPLERYEFFGNGAHIAIDNGLRVVFQRGIPFQYGRTTSYAPPGVEHGAIVWEPQNMLATPENHPLYTQGIVGSLQHFCDAVMDSHPPSRGDLAVAHHLMRIYEAALLSDGHRVPLGPASAPV
jgi:predicted dehydrogenase